MTNYKYLRGASISDPSRVIFDIPDTPTIGTATDVGTSRAYNNGAATVTITGTAVTGGPTTGYTVTSSPDGFTASGTSPITVTGLSSATSYTFTAKATNTSGSSPASTATSAITATTVPQAPTIGTFTDGGTGTTGTLSFTAGSTGGKSITGYKVSTDGTTYTTVSGTTSPLSLTGLTPGSYTFYLKATNANGDSSASSGVSGTVAVPMNFYSIATATVTSGGSGGAITFSSIPSTYTHLQLRFYAQGNYGGDNQSGAINLQFNGDTTGNYYFHGTNMNYSNGAVGSYAVGPAGYLMPSTMALSSSNQANMGVGICDIFDYTNTNKYKTIRGISGNNNNTGIGGSSYALDASYVSGVWNSTSAVNSISVYNPNGSQLQFNIGSVIALYGVK